MCGGRGGGGRCLFILCLFVGVCDKPVERGWSVGWQRGLLLEKKIKRTAR